MTMPGAAQLLSRIKTPHLNEKPLHVLLIENERGDAQLYIHALQQDGFTVRAEVAQTREEFRTQLSSNTYDIILADHRPMASTGLEALEYLRQKRCDVPVIIVTGRLDEEAAVGCIKAGATDYILKAELWRLPLAVRRAVDERALRERRIRVEQALSLEQRLRQSGQMEAVGRVAGGLAHDFNNLLTAILGYSDLLLERLPANSQLSRYAAEVKKASEQAFSLTRQLLAFSRQQVLAPQVLSLNAMVADMQKVLRPLMGEHIELVTQLEPQLGNVKADRGQIEQVILNLALNSRDAMANCGRLTIETANVELHDGHDMMVFEQSGVRAGTYVMMAISDTGCGMDAETQARIFEPFFTTKSKDQSAGLGLSTVYGIVKQSKGYISVRSEPGHGTTFKVYLSPAEEDSSQARSRPTFSTAPQRSETVLLVEDEDAVRELTRMTLLSKGYKVLEAASGEEALKICEGHSGPIHLMVTDVIMPNVSGQELAQRITTLRPETKVLYISGYTSGVLRRLQTSNPETAFLQKPFTRETLICQVRQMLDGG